LPAASRPVGFRALPGTPHRSSDRASFIDERLEDGVGGVSVELDLKTTKADGTQSPRTVAAGWCDLPHP